MQVDYIGVCTVCVFLCTSMRDCIYGMCVQVYVRCFIAIEFSGSLRQKISHQSIKCTRIRLNVLDYQNDCWATSNDTRKSFWNVDRERNDKIVVLERRALGVH